MARCLRVFIFGLSAILSFFSLMSFAQDSGPTTGSQVYSWDFSKTPFYPTQSDEIVFNNNLYIMYFNIGKCVPQSLPSTSDFTYSPSMTCSGVANSQGASSFGVFPFGSNAVSSPIPNQVFSIELQLNIPTPITATSTTTDTSF